MRWFTGAAIMVVALVVAGAAWADVIELTNGDKVEGKILEEGTAGVKIQTKFGAIIVPRRSIKRVIKEGPAQQEYREKAMELAKEHVELARWCEEKGLEEEAKKHYEMALRFDPDNEDAKKALGAGKKEGEQAGKEPEKKGGEGPAERITQEELLRLRQEAIAKLQNKEYEEAEKLYKKIINAMPNDNNALYNLACLYSLTDKNELAIEFLKKAVKAGFTNVGHIEKDTDLDNIREEEAYKKLIEQMKKGDKRNM